MSLVGLVIASSILTLRVTDVVPDPITAILSPGWKISPRTTSPGAWVAASRARTSRS